MITAASKSRRLRGVVLELLRTNHDGQQSRFDSIALWSALVRGLNFDVGQNEVATVLQDLCQRGYVSYTDRRNKETNKVYIMQVMLLPKGRDVLEGTIEDPAVEL